MLATTVGGGGFHELIGVGEIVMGEHRPNCWWQEVVLKVFSLVEMEMEMVGCLVVEDEEWKSV
jgi:hypothetical protein